MESLNRQLLVLSGLTLFFYGLVWTKAPIVAPDSKGYIAAARDLRGLHYRTIGYPILLRLAGSSAQPKRSLFYTSLLLHFSTVYLLAISLTRLGLPRAAVSLFCVLLLLPPFVEPAAYVLTENLSAFTLTAGLSACIAWAISNKLPFLLLAGIAFGYAGLVRPSYQLLAAFLSVSAYFLSRGRHLEILKIPVLLTAGSVVIIGGLCFRNYVRFCHFGTDTALGVQLTTKTVRVIDRLPDEYAPAREILIKYRDQSIVKRGSSHTGYAYAYDGAVSELRERTGMSELAVSQFLRHLNWLAIRGAPLTYVQECFWSVGSYWMPSSTKLSFGKWKSVQMIWSGLHFLVALAFLLQCTVVLGVKLFSGLRQLLGNSGVSFGASHSQRTSYILAVCIISYSMAISCLFGQGDARHRVPTDPIILLAVFLGCQIIWNGLRVDPGKYPGRHATGI